MPRSRERLYWTLGAIVVLGTWATLQWARSAAEWLRERDLITETMWGIFAVAAGAVLLFVVRRRPHRLELAVLAAFGVLYLLAILPLMGRPEEALHFVQYGLVGGLFYAALVERRAQWAAGGAAGGAAGREAAAGAEARPRTWLAWPGAAALAAFLMTGAAGWIDEGIQHLLPERVYDLRDVGFNAAAGALAIAAIACRRWARERPRLVVEGG